MHLTRLQALGFKSFAQKLDMPFQKGITCVVGPNGCGKSNVVDALRWALGEQRPRSLRSGSMGDVIFSGTRSRKPLGMSEVSLTLDNSQKILPTEFSEVTITRRLFRSGESDYLLNKIPCRLKDIQNLLMDTGLGTQSSYVIEQGMVDEIISDNAEERRRCFEEAAGVTRYKIRRRSAWNRLIAVRQDLQRMEDWLGEIQRQVASLQRQERKARLYKTLSDELRDLEIKLARFQYFDLADQSGPMREEMIFLKEDIEISETNITTLEAQLEEMRVELTDQDRALAEVNIELSQHIERVHSKDSEILVAREEVRSIQAFLERAGHQQKSFKTRLDSAQKGQKAAEQDKREAAKKLEIAEARLEAETAKLEAEIQDLDTQRTQVDAQKSQLMNQLRQSSDQGKGLERLQAEREGIVQRQTRLTQDIERVAARRQEADEIANQSAEQIAAVEGRIAQRTEERQQQIAGRDRCIAQRDEQVESRNRLRANIEADQARVALLQKLREGFEGYSKGVRALAVDSPFSNRIQGVVADMVDVNPEYVTAIEAALGRALECLIVRNTDDARWAIDFLRQGEHGAAAFLPLERIISTNGTPCEVPKGEGIVGLASNLLNPQRDAHGAVSALLRHTLIVSDAQTALVHSGAMHAKGVDIVTLSGEVFSADGTVYGGADATSETGLIGRQQQIADLQSAIKSAQAKLKTRETQVAHTLKTLDKHLAQIEACDNALADLHNRRAGLQRDRQNAETEAKRQARAVTELDQETAQLAERESELMHLIAQAQEEQTKLDAKRETLEDIVRRADEDLRKKEHQRRVLQDGVAAVRVEIASLKERIESLAHEAVRQGREHEAISREIERLSAEADESQNRKREREESIGTASGELEVLHKQQSRIEHKRDAQARRQHEIVMAARAIEEKLREKNRRTTQHRERLSELQVAMAHIKERGEGIIERLKRDYEVDIAEKGRFQDPEFNADMAEKKTHELQERMRRMGSVNLAALEEYEVQKERLEFLTQQRDDLLEAEEIVKRTITRIDRTARQRFLNTFGSIRENFQNTFQEFFEGGEADLTMPPEEDPLEAPIIITARPWGKRLQSINLLSGGERALTAIALLFAIYLVKPSPFCVLDEVDAPLDDANIARFVKVIKKFSEQSQFIVVTHNKGTMESGETLHGVTMEEPGVSRLVSVKMSNNSENQVDDVASFPEAVAQPADDD
ncbi:MAG: chromosome segregation protein SMC [Candidatus Latescibacteria bacterium]|nr:chromosome segregation protein SMC [Candidatus Latescibacterota bacterium]